MLGKKLGKYAIQQWLGGGRFGDVYLARDEILDQNFALKIARPRALEMDMLKSEARLLCALNHPGIVRFYNVDIIDGQAVLVLEYVHGQSLREIIKSGGLEIDRVVEISRQIAEALAYAHNQGVWHRDLKPENILLNEDGDVKIADFGLARFTRDQPDQETAAGTPLYLAPEAWTGCYEDRSDLWSFGVVLYELLTGEPPFMDEDLARLKKKISRGSFVTPSLRRDGFPPHLEDLINACLNVDACSRPAAGAVLAWFNRHNRGVAAEDGYRPPDFGVVDIALTPDQTAAIADLNRQILLLGAAGSGKTATLIQAMVKLVLAGVEPSDLLAVTFTNKAALDIKERLNKMPGMPEAELWIGTCHNLAYKILQRDAARLDLSPDFTILDGRSIIKQMGLATGQYRDRAVLQFIEGLKARGLGPDDYQPDNEWESSCLARYHAYDQYCREHEVLDFDDLIRLAARLLDEHADLRKQYQHRFRYVFLDELQDLNPAQYHLVTRLIREPFFFTGDPDQAIYGWRGAERELVYRVSRDFPGTTVISLNRSFRLPRTILEAAGRLLKRDTPIIPGSETGEVQVYAAASEADEGKYVAGEIKCLRAEGYHFQEIAVLFRTNALARIYVEAFSRAGIPFSSVGSTAGRERSSLKPVFEYLAWLEHPGSDAEAQVQSVLKDVCPSDEAVRLFRKHRAPDNKPAIREIITDLVAVIKIPAEDLKSLQSWIQGSPGLTIARLLNEMKLMQELDIIDWQQDKVRLLTMHSAKGLEYPAVFVTDLTEEIVPLAKSTLSARDLEEERRLCYVAITRAKKKLFLVYPKIRQGRTETPSRFLRDMFRRDA